METDPQAVRRTWLGILLRSATLRERMAAVRAVGDLALAESDWPREQFDRWEQLLGGDADSGTFPRLHERLRWENFTPAHAALALKTLPAEARDYLLRHLKTRPWAKLLLHALPEIGNEKWLEASWRELRLRATDEEYELARSLRSDLETDLRQRLDWWLEKTEADMVQLPDQAALARALATECTHWARSWKLFLRRWLRDFATEYDQTADPLVKVTATSSDPHKGGQRVTILTQRDGSATVYKPRDVSHEAVYWSFAKFLIDQVEGAPFFPAIPVTSRGGYGWMEFAHTEDEPGAVPAIASRAEGMGMTLCLMHLLGATDMHHENLLLSNGADLPIDLESLFYRYSGSIGGVESARSALQMAAQLADGSVWQTGLLPQWWRPEPRKLWDISGFFGGAADQVSMPMEAGGLTQARLATLSRPARFHPSDGANGLVEGFRTTYRWFLDNRDILLKEGSPWWNFNPRKTRYFHRPTREYERLRERLREPGLLRDGVTRSFALERLFRLPFDHAPASPSDRQGNPPGAGDANYAAIGKSPVPGFSGRYRRALGRMSTMEALSLERGDVPSFRIEDLEHLGIAELPPDISPIAAFAEGREAFLRRILENQLSEADLYRQIDDIRTALASAIDEFQLYRHLANLPTDADMSTEAVAPVPAPAPDPLAKARENATLFGNAAEILGERLVTRAVRGEDGSVLWVDGAGLKPTPSGHPLEAFYLYLGRLGPILFLAAAGAELKRFDFTETAQGALDPLLAGILEQDWTRQPSSYEAEKTPPRLDPGFGTGIGGLLYGLAVLSRWLPARAERLEAAARELVPLLNPELSHGWSCADIESGVAGGLLGLLAAHQTWGLPNAVPYARQFAKSLDRRAVDGPLGGRAWYFPDAESGEMMAGFGHGASGIATALCRLAETPGMATNSMEAETWLHLASEAWRYEATVFDAEKVNWPVVGVRRPGGGLFLNAWCNGAPGIGYSRVLGLDQDPDLMAPELLETLRGELLSALKTTLQKGISVYDHVCCGTGARLEALLSIAPRLPADFPKAAEYRSVLRSSAASLGRAMLNRAFTPNPQASAGENPPLDAPPVFRLTPNAELDLAFNSGFFRGISGLGYLYLRLAEDQRALAQSATDALDDPGATTPDPMPGERLPSIIFGEL